MMTEIDMWWYGETAQEESARRADEFGGAGDPIGAACWRRIIGAIEELENMTPYGLLH